MKKIIFPIAFFCIFLSVSPADTFAQEQEIASIRLARFEENSLGAGEIYMYCVIEERYNNKVAVSFGYNDDYWRDVFLSVGDGKRAGFDSAIQAVNWLSSRGWESVDFVRHSLLVEGGTRASYYCCLMRKNIETLSEIDRNRFLKDVGMKR